MDKCPPYALKLLEANRTAPELWTRIVLKFSTSCQGVIELARPVVTAICNDIYSILFLLNVSNSKLKQFKASEPMDICTELTIERVGFRKAGLKPFKIEMDNAWCSTKRCSFAFL